MAENAQDRIDALIERFFWAIVALILFVALAFRLPGLDSRSLWIDELFSEWFSSRSFTELWRDVPLYETHPPIYYTLLKLWTLLVGNSELGLRSLSLVASLATVFLIAVSGRLVKAAWPGKAVGLLGAALLAVNYANIREAQNARPYSLLTLLFTVAIIAALILVGRLQRGIDVTEQRGGWMAPGLILGLTVGCTLWFHNTSLFVALGIWSGLALTLIVTPAELRLRNFAIFFAAGVLALLVWAPYVPIFIQQSSTFMGLGFWLEPKTRDFYSAWMLFVGDSWPALLLGIVFLGLGLFRLVRSAPASALLVAAILVIPLYAVLAVSFSLKPIYLQRLFVWMVPLALLVIALGIVTATRSQWPRLVLALIVMALAATRSMEENRKPIDDWKGIVAEIARNARPGDVVIAAPAEGIIAVDYYARRQPNFPPIVCVPGCYPQRNLPRPYGSNFGAPKLILADGEIVERALKTHGRVWLVQVSVSLYDPKSIVRSRIAAARTFVRYHGNALAKVELFE
ncbi:glycosyltransferase family 39 protein [Rhizobium sp. TH2]|uniref:glycosyltransferase family 39 protein n=1 Tax=Rhizobium sp. TH2 TaxID=2775403 RepID=UPI00215736F3|nr:glycosyltransferase family 39 protein [Rhizobium sp. TH2]UVC06992.1 glycosyltransferase family 39 protein [Rhizobium sp. TH2]